MSGLIKFEDQDKFFIKFFLLDATLNLNKWGVTEKSLRDGLDSFIGKPFVLTSDYDHPSAENGDDLMIQQEKYRVGNIIMVGIEERSGKAYGVAEITNKEAIDVLKGGDVNFVSPSIVFEHSDETDINGNAIIDSWEGAHVAGVSEPAYTIEKAQIKGKCSGDKETCLNTLNKVEASRSACGKYTIVKTANTRIIGNASQCVENCIKEKREHGKEINEQALAICYSECGEASADYPEDNFHPEKNKSPKSDDKKQNMKRKIINVRDFVDDNVDLSNPKTIDNVMKDYNDTYKNQVTHKEVKTILSDLHNKEDVKDTLDLLYKGNIDSESLKNITKIDLLKKKKNAQDDSDVTSQNKKKITMPKKSIFVKKKKTKEQHLKELEDYELQMQSFSRKKG